ncbi:hypothetical protein BZA05DRAFT_402483 [Tricharina praecox]|uniref:uncharacterized protein n=1 Tax=Tricharina praecox TaxID=43433 RepID=UPI0022200689|nr:uncharacterized protein BZA05DRAFT_402483 [Tricharina praecox]KAI5849185.1 hypothetical protein BZA05DRAFT_402483 [Tricharina praecox]
MAFTLASEASSGYFRYRCKNFYTHNCDNWVWVNNTACAECVAAGRDEEQLEFELEHESTGDYCYGGGGSGAVSLASVLPPDGADVGRQCPMTARLRVPSELSMLRAYNHGHDNDYEYDALIFSATNAAAADDCEA